MLGLYNKCIQSLDNYPNVVVQTFVDWNILNNVQTDLSVEWDQASFVQRDFNLEYAMAGLVSTDTVYEWRVNYENFPVFLETTYEWAVRTELYKEIDVVWGVDQLDLEKNIVINSSTPDGFESNSSFAVYGFTADTTLGGDITTSMYDARDGNRATGDKAFNSQDDKQFEGSMWFTPDNFQVFGSGGDVNIGEEIPIPPSASNFADIWWQIPVFNSTRNLKIKAFRFCTPDGLYEADSGSGETLTSYPRQFKLLASTASDMLGNDVFTVKHHTITEVLPANTFTEWYEFDNEITTDQDWYLRFEVIQRHNIGDWGSHKGCGVKSFEFAVEVEEKYTGIVSFCTDTDAKILFAPYRPETELVDTVVLENRVNSGNGDFTVDFQAGGSSDIGYTEITELQPVYQEDNIYSCFAYQTGNSSSLTKIESGSGAVAVNAIKDEWTIAFYGTMDNGVFRLNALGGGASVLSVSNSGATVSVRNTSGTVENFTVPIASPSAITFITRNQSELLHVVYEGTSTSRVTRLQINDSQDVTEDSGYTVDHSNPVTLRSANSVEVYIGLFALWARKLSLAEIYTFNLMLRLGTNIPANSLTLSRLAAEGTTLGSIYEGVLLENDVDGIATGHLVNTVNKTLEENDEPDQGKLLVPSIDNLGKYSYVDESNNFSDNELFGTDLYAPVFMGEKDVYTSGEARWANNGSLIDIFSTSKNHNPRYDYVSFSVTFSPCENIFYNPIIPLFYQTADTDDNFFCSAVMSNRYLYVWLRKQEIHNTDDDYVRYEIESPYSTYGVGKVTQVTVNIPLFSGDDLEWIVDGVLVGSVTVDFDPYLGETPVGGSGTNFVPNLYTMGKASGDDTYNGLGFDDTHSAYGSTGTGLMGIHRAHNDTHLHSDSDKPTNVRLFNISSVYRKVTPEEDRTYWEESQAIHPTTNLAGFVFDKPDYCTGYYPLWETDSKQHQEYTNNGFNAVAATPSSLSGTSLGYNQNGYTGGVVSHKQVPRDLRVIDQQPLNPYRHVGDKDAHFIDFYATPVLPATSGTSGEAWRPRNVFMEQRQVGTVDEWTPYETNTYNAEGKDVDSNGVMLFNPDNNEFGATTSFIYRSEDRGRSWRKIDVTADLGGSNLQYLCNDGDTGHGRWLGIADDFDVWYSDDGGYSWAFSTSLTGSFSVADMIYGGGYFVAAGFIGSGVRVHWSTDGSSWSYEDGGQSNSYINEIHYDDTAGEWAISCHGGRIGWTDDPDTTGWDFGYPYPASGNNIYWCRFVYGRWYFGLAGGSVLAVQNSFKYFRDTNFATGTEVVVNGDVQDAEYQENCDSVYIDSNGDLVGVCDGFGIQFTASTTWSHDVSEPWLSKTRTSDARYDSVAELSVFNDTHLAGAKGFYKKSHMDVAFSIGTDTTGSLRVGRKTRHGSDLLSFNSNADLDTVKLHHVLLKFEGEDVTCWVDGTSAGTQTFSNATGIANVGDMNSVFSVGHGIDQSGDYEVDTESCHVIGHLGVWWEPHWLTAFSVPSAFAPRYDRTSAISYTPITQTPTFQLLASDLVAGTGNNSSHSDGQSVSSWYDNISDSMQFVTVDGTVVMRTGTSGIGKSADGSNLPAIQVDGSNTLSAANSDRMRLTQGQTLYNAVGDDDASTTGTDKGTLIVVGRLDSDFLQTNGQYNSNLTSFATGGGNGSYLGVTTPTGDDTEVIGQPESIIPTTPPSRLYSASAEYHGYDLSKVTVMGSSWYYKNYTMNADGYSDVLRSSGISAGGMAGEMHPSNDISNPEDDATLISNTNSPAIDDGAWLCGYKQNGGGSTQQFKGYLAEVSWYDDVLDQWQFNILQIRKSYEHGLVMGMTVDLEIACGYHINYESFAIMDNPQSFTLTTGTFTQDVATTFSRHSLPINTRSFQAATPDSEYVDFYSEAYPMATENFLFNKEFLFNTTTLTLETKEAYGASLPEGALSIYAMEDIVAETITEDYIGDWLFDEHHIKIPLSPNDHHLLDRSANGHTIKANATGGSLVSGHRVGLNSFRYGTNYGKISDSTTTDFNTTDVTVTLLMRVVDSGWTGSGTRYGIVGNHQFFSSYTGDNSGYKLGITGDYKPTFLIGSGTGTVSGTDFDEVVSSEALTVGQWYLVTGTYDGSDIKIYVEGTERGTTSYSGGIGYDTTPENCSLYMEFGYYDQQDVFNAPPNDDIHYNAMRIYDRALSQTDIAYLASTVYPENKVVDGYVARLKCNETDAHNASTDTGNYSYSTYPFSISNNTVITQGNYYSAFDLTTDNYYSQYATTPSDIFRDNEMTLIFEVRLNTTSSIKGIYADAQLTQGIRVWTETNGRVSLGMHNGSSVQEITGTTNIHDDEWHVIIIEHSQVTDTAKLYIDGTQEGGDLSIASISYGLGEPQLGFVYESSSFRYLKGYYSELFYYDRLLTAQEITDMSTEDLI